ncbi:MAG: hypothetical protein WD512_18440 [Candidatus Paceibacterota bacterium]
MKKVAKLVTVSFMTRVVVDEDASEDQIIEAARPKFFEKVKVDLGDCIEEIIDDEEMPYGEGLNEN